MTTLLVLSLLTAFCMWYVFEGARIRHQRKACKEFRRWIKHVLPADFDDERRNHQ